MHKTMHGQVDAPDNAGTANHGLVAGQWRRASRYELRDGYIRPAPGGKIKTYDPVKLWLKTRPKGRGAYQDAPPTPYQALLNLLHSLDYSPDQRAQLDRPLSLDEQKFAREQGLKESDFKFPGPGEVSLPAAFRVSLTAESEKQILEWCAEYGLLGILPHRALQATLATRGGVQVKYIRTGAGWTTIELPNDHPQFTELRSAPHALLQALPGRGIVIEPLSTTWGRFFPDVPAAERQLYPYPVPLSDEFWKIYAEPLEDFLAGARALKAVFEAVQLYRHSRKDRKIRGLHEILMGGMPAVVSAATTGGLAVQVPNSGEARLYLVGPSLLASLAVTMLEDLLKGRALQCECGAPFVSTTYQGRYCSEQCRWTYQKQRQRATLKARRLTQPLPRAGEVE